MAGPQKPGALKTKTYELVLEKFFYEYITVWYRERNVSATDYDKARKEIDLLKEKKKNKTKKCQQGGASTTEADVSEVRNLSNDVPNTGGDSKRPKSAKKRQTLTKADSPKPLATSSTAARQQRNDNKDDLQRAMLEKYELEKKLSTMRDKLHQTRADAHIELKEKEEQIEKLKTYLENSKAHIDDLSKRLSKLAGDKLRQGNPDLADLSDPNRPTEIGKFFSEVYDNEWSDAFENIPKMEEEKKVGVLHGIVTRAFSFCEKKFNEQTLYVRAILLGLEQEGTSDIEPQVPLDGNKTVRSVNIHNVLADTRKQLALETAGNVANEFSSAVFEQLVSGLGMKKNTIHKTLRNYAKKCIELCWLMMVCDPQMALSEDKEGKPFDTNIYKPYTKSTKDLKNPVVQLHVWPALHLHINGPLVAKGVAQPSEGQLKPK